MEAAAEFEQDVAEEESEQESSLSEDPDAGGSGEAVAGGLRTADGPPAVCGLTSSRGSVEALLEARGSVEALLEARGSVEALLEASWEDSSVQKKQEPCDVYYSPGWEEAVQGWSRAALSCVFLPQRKRRKPKNDEEPRPHCVLCVDTRPPEAPGWDGPPEAPGWDGPPEAPGWDRPPESRSPESHADPRDGGANTTNAAAPSSAPPTALYSSSASGPSALKEAPRCASTLGARQHHPLLLREKMATDTRVRDALLLPRPSPPHHPAAPKSRCYDLRLPIHAFTVLPPVKTPRFKPQRAVHHQVCFGESAGAAGGGGGGGGGGSREAGGGAVPRSARRSRVGVERGTEETGGADDTSATNPKPPKEDAYNGAVTPPPRAAAAAAAAAMYCQSAENTRQLLSTFTVPLLKRYEVPLSDTAHRTVSVSRRWKRTGAECDRGAGSTAPQLPLLLGTKVPMVGSSHRPLMHMQIKLSKPYPSF